MPRRNKSDATVERLVSLPRFDSGYGGYEKQDYLEVGLGRRLETASVNTLLNCLGMTGVKASNKSGVVYIAGNEMAKRVNYGFIPGRPRMEPHNAVDVLVQGLLTEVDEDKERESLALECRGFGVKNFGTTALKVVAHLSDVLNEANEPVVMSERLRFMDLLKVDQKPSVKPYELITHHAEVGTVEGYTLSQARKIIREAHGAASQLNVNLLPVGHVLSALPDNWT
jgi:hypothetical protein